MFPGLEDEEEATTATSGRLAKRGARQAISDKREIEGRKNKKSSMNVRTAVLYRKSFAVLLDESVRAIERGYAS